MEDDFDMVFQDLGTRIAPMSDGTRLLEAIEAGVPQAGDQLLPLVCEELRSLAAANMAREKTKQMEQARPEEAEGAERGAGQE